MGIEKKVDPLKECCYNCDDYVIVNKRAKCEDGHNMGEMKKLNYPCFPRHYHLTSYSGSGEEKIY